MGPQAPCYYIRKNCLFRHRGFFYWMGKPCDEFLVRCFKNCLKAPSVGKEALALTLRKPWLSCDSPKS